MYLLKIVKVFCSFMRFTLSPPCLGYSFAGVAVPYHVLNPRAATVCSRHSIDSPVASGIQCLCSRLLCPFAVLGTEHLSFKGRLPTPPPGPCHRPRLAAFLSPPGPGSYLMSVFC